MKVILLGEYGYEWATLGFSLSYRSTLERTEAILPKYAHGVAGEDKFLEMMQIYLDVYAPRFWWQEADTYRVGSTKQSESTMHTITKQPITIDNFEYSIPSTYTKFLNGLIDRYKGAEKEKKLQVFLRIKNALPEGFIQRRIWNINYKSFRNMYYQRLNHRLPQWRYFCDTVLGSLSHPEFIVKDYKNA